MFSVRLTSLRKKKNVTQQKVADYLGITRPAYTAYEQGKRQPDYETLTKIADFFDVTVDYLIGRTDDPQGDSLKDDEQVLDGFWGYDLTGLSEKEMQELKKQIRKEIEFYLWQREQDAKK
ncbi:helix-turn-helix domain-containing protein [Priestia megaterium]|uniref:helix-turn-helix domain-containing protein n=1 Tax=Priestia megaterium TaxID=1404 RepID=UPI000BED613F|nr:helix-turn-helix transcriptional regulator [Priestia megaterium]MBE2973036.1 helix-turn-helix transcriptional regulator [Priestia megaterium]MED4064393.1 helix-turn-helix transcriptional regulator [Priestia megaterium]PEA38439.1 transcriptional regulator [Priestia megaterium]